MENESDMESIIRMMEAGDFELNRLSVCFLEKYIEDGHNQFLLELYQYISNQIKCKNRFYENPDMFTNPHVREIWDMILEWKVK
jgi:hypothetical protein